jgi:hypothetical protein
MSKLYVFANSYLSDIQKGIQTAHLVDSLWRKYFTTQSQAYFFNWFNTIVLFNGGNNDTMHKTRKFFNHPDNHYPWALFYEDLTSLNNLLTVVGIILPEKFSATEDRLDYIDGKIGTVFDANMAEILENSHLA